MDASLFIHSPNGKHLILGYYEKTDCKNLFAYFCVDFNFQLIGTNTWEWILHKNYILFYKKLSSKETVSFYIPLSKECELLLVSTLTGICYCHCV